jgi:tRNA(Ile)-lysidine synthase
MSSRSASDRLVTLRAAVGSALADLEPGATVLVACSGGPDSLALAGATAWVGHRRGLAVRAVVVDHGLQPGSGDTARRAASACGALGIADAEVVAVEVRGGGGPEAAARDARYAALAAAASACGSQAVLLGHTREDQAETVLLRLARGSGARSLSAMRARSGLWRRPFLALARVDVLLAGSEMLAPLDLTAWRDPHNDDRSFARVRVRALLAGLVDDLGPGVVLGLTRTADLLRDDADALEAWRDRALAELVRQSDSEASSAVDDLLALPRAVRTRMLRQLCLRMGCPADRLDFDHIERVEALVSAWHGQGEIRLPGGVVALRSCGRLCLRQE